MKTKELIRRLQAADPSGETEVCVDNDDIHFVDREAAYWDGCLRVLIRDESLGHCYNVKGVRYVSSGDKVVIRPMGVNGVLLNDSDAVIDYSGLTEQQAARYRESDERERAENKKIERKLELDLFTEWAEGRVGTSVTADELLKLRTAVRDFFGKNISPKDPLPAAEPGKDGGCLMYPSYVNRRKAQWDSTVQVEWTGAEFRFGKVPEKQSPVF